MTRASAAALAVHDGRDIALWVARALRHYRLEHEQIGRRIPDAAIELEQRLMAVTAGQIPPRRPAISDTRNWESESWLLPPEKAAEWLAISPRTLRRRTTTGEIRAIRGANLVRYRPEDLIEYLQRAAS